MNICVYTYVDRAFCRGRVYIYVCIQINTYACVRTYICIVGIHMTGRALNTSFTCRAPFTRHKALFMHNWSLLYVGLFSYLTGNISCTIGLFYM